MSTSDAVQLNTELIYQLRGLGMAGAVLHVGAHPDDEDVGLRSRALSLRPRLRGEGSLLCGDGHSLMAFLSGGRGSRLLCGI